MPRIVITMPHARQDHIAKNVAGVPEGQAEELISIHAMLRLAGFRMVEWSIVPRSFHLSYITHPGFEPRSSGPCDGADL